MARWILDASALLVLINQEPGADRVFECLPEATMSSVNYSEVASVLNGLGVPKGEARSILRQLIQPLSFTEEQACICGELYHQTRNQGLSLGDRACLALAKKLKLPILTADRAWVKVDIGVQIELIRS